MQAPTHILTGVLIYKIFYSIFVGSNVIVLGVIIFIVSFCSHFLTDVISNITYHLPEEKPNDKFWVGYHIIISIMALIFIFIYWNSYWIGISGTLLIDIIDWFILRYLFKKKAIIHPLINKFKNKFFFWMPNLIEKKWAVINELIIMVIIGIWIYLI